MSYVYHLDPDEMAHMSYVYHLDPDEMAHMSYVYHLDPDEMAHMSYVYHLDLHFCVFIFAFCLNLNFAVFSLFVKYPFPFYHNDLFYNLKWKSLPKKLRGESAY